MPNEKVKQAPEMEIALNGIKEAIAQKGLKHSHVAKRAGITGIHLSRVLNSWAPLTISLRDRLLDILAK